MKMTEEQRQHLEFIQGVINRMNGNSFQVKGLAITLIAALIAFYSSKSSAIIIFTGIVLSLLFWSLDAYYLQQERKYRALYDTIANTSGATQPIIITNYSMSVTNYTGSTYTWFSSFISNTIYWVYLALVALLLLILCL